MQKPPDRKSPPVLFTRSANEWINRINQKHKELASLSPSTQQKENLDRWAEAEFICSTLALGGINVSREAVARIVSSNSTDASKMDDNSVAVVELLKAVRIIESLAHTNGRAAALTPDVLLELHGASGRADGFRKSAGNARGALKPAPAEHLVATIESACRWFSAESFAELNPIEQASIVYLRLYEIQPFEQASERTALVAASLFTMRSELPLIIITRELDRAYRAALNEGARMNTSPMVELTADAVERSLAEMIGRVS
jgi:Fic family protein